MADSSALFHTAAEYIEKIKRICEHFDFSRIEFYNQLHRKQTEDAWQSSRLKRQTPACSKIPPSLSSERTKKSLNKLVHSETFPLWLAIRPGSRAF
jgi:hypothetical protein